MIFRLVLLLCLSFILPLPLSAQARHVENTKEILEIWSPDQHLYVRGELPVTQQALDQLESWLDGHGKNWTVVLLQNSKGETWEDERGKSFKEMDAVENILGRGLGNLPGFSDLKDVQTGERNGAVFVLFLAERQFSYFASDVYDKRDLGESGWVGRLDRPAGQAMRSGGRMIDAVKDTITAIDERLAVNINKDRPSTQEKERRAERQKQYLDELAVSLLQRIDKLDNQTAALRAAQATAGEDLANPDVNQWRKVVNDAKENNNLDATDNKLYFGSDEFTRTSERTLSRIKRSQDLAAVESGLEYHRFLLDSWYQDFPVVQQLRGELAGIKVDKDFRNGAFLLKKAAALVDQAIDAHKKASSSYRMHYERAQNIKEQIEEGNSRAAKLREAKQLALQERLIKRRNTYISVCSIVVALVVLIGFILNWHRRSVKLKAEALVSTWREKLKDRGNRLFNALDEATLKVGTESDLMEQQITGRTREESIKAIRGIDYAFVLSASAEHVLEQAQSMVFPKGILRQLANFFSGKSYSKAIERLTVLPITIKPGADRSFTMGNRSMLGEKLTATQFTYRFEDLISKLDQTLDTAEKRIELVHAAWSSVPGHAQQLGSQLLEVRQKLEVVKRYNQNDSWFSCAVLESKWCPAASALQVEVLRLASCDPLSAMESTLLRAEEMVGEMITLLQGIIDYRELAIGEALKLRERMDQAGRNTNWIIEQLDDFSDEFLAIMEAGVQRSVRNKIEQSLEKLQEFSHIVTTADMVVASAGTEFVEKERETCDSISNTRDELSADLKLPVEKILCEDGINPSTVVEQAVQHERDAMRLIDDGRVMEAKACLDKAFTSLQHANSIVNHTRSAFEEFPERLANGQESETETRRLLGEMQKTLAELSSIYLPPALLFDVQASSGEGYTQAIEHAVADFDNMHGALVSAPKLFEQAQILAAQEALIKAEEVAAKLDNLHSGINQRRDDLLAVEASNNAVLAERNAHLATCAEVINQHYVELPTQRKYQELCIQRDEAEVMVKAAEGQRSPYHAQRLLGSLMQGADAFDRAVLADQENYNVALKVQAATEGLLQDAMNLVHKSRFDEIPDSLATTQSTEKVEAVEGRLRRTWDQLQVAHSQWLEITAMIQGIANDLASSRNVLEDELELAEHAQRALDQCRGEVRNAMHWSGSYGVRVTGDYGSYSLDQAVKALMNGLYQESMQFAGKAEREASQAISRAESEVASIRRQREAEARRQHEEWLARQRVLESSSSESSSSRASSYSSSSSSTKASSSSGFSRSSSSSGSGFSRSSSSSGSGFSRSGW